MTLTFEQKKQILTYMSSRENWVFHDDSAEEGLHSGRFFNRLRFNPDNFEDMGFYNLANSVKLIIARDLGVEPALRAETQNPNPTSVSNIFISFPEGQDSSVFNGHEVDIPHRFAIEFRGKSGFDLATEGGYKDWITTQTSIATAAYENAENTCPTGSRCNIKDLFNTKGTALNSYGENWLYIIAKSGNLEHLKRKAQEFKDNAALEKRDFMALQIEPKKLLLAANTKALKL